MVILRFPHTALPNPFLAALIDNDKTKHLDSPPLDSSFRCTQPTSKFMKDRVTTVAAVNIESYIPVGCLRIHRNETSISREVWNSHTSWSSFASSDNPADRGNEVTLAKEVQAAISQGLKRYGYKPARKDLCRFGWVRMEFKVNARHMESGQVRIFILPDDVGRISCPREDTDLRNQVLAMLYQMDTSPDTFNGSWDPKCAVRYINYSHRSEEEITKELSLLHIFNHLPSPNPEPDLVRNHCSSEAMRDLLANDVDGLRANLFRFQGRTAAAMLQREAQPSEHLDPRLIVRKDMAGDTWYVNMVTGEWRRQWRTIDDPRGGILAEHMGRGKTLICLALIMATRGHYPDMPVEYANEIPIREKVGSLKEMTAARIACSNIPWRSFFQQLLERSGDDYYNCLEAIRGTPSYYTVKPPKVRTSTRLNSQSMPEKKIFRAPTTIVVVPPNLVDQWLNEIEKHTLGLKVLVMKDKSKKLPPPDELIEYDLILFSRHRLEQEFIDITNRETGDTFHEEDCCIYRTGFRHCTCRHSPLSDLHFKRIITDEGHFIGNSGGRSVSKAVQVMSNLIVDSRWVVSGTPTQGLYGVESNQKLTDRYSVGHANATENDHKQQQKDVEKIGNICTAFLKSEPWTSDGSWSKFNMQSRYGGIGSVGEPDRLRAIMENTVLRTKAEDVESEIALPDLHQKIVYLDASIQDSIQLNIFVLNIISNAITSERKDADYLFHIKHRNTLNELVRNLRQATFFWSGWTVENVLSTLQIATEFLTQRKTPISGEDEELLRGALAIGENILKLICSSPEQRHSLDKTTLPIPSKALDVSPPHALSIFEASSTTDEIPIYVRNEFPEDVRKAWALDRSGSNPTLFGFTQLKAFNDSVTSSLWNADPLQGLDEVGVKAMESCREPGEAKAKMPTAKGRGSAKEDVLALPSQPSTLKGKSPAKGKKKAATERPTPSFPTLAGGATVGGNISPRKPRRHILREANGSNIQKRPFTIDSPTNPDDAENAEPKLKSALKSSASTAQTPTIDPESKLASAQIESTASAKLTYLIAQILAVKDEEKSIIFYEEETVGYYLAQALEAIGVEYLIYAKTKTLSSALQSRWLRKFADEDKTRVLLMDLGAGTFGLDISCASRVFFVNPVFNPQVEAQAIKRAHRIGQTKPVYVEVLVMRGSMEEKIVERRKQLGDGDFSGFKTILDDDEMYEWVKNPNFLSLPDTGENVLSKSETMAKLDVPHRIFGALIRNAENETGINNSGEDEVPSHKLKLNMNFNPMTPPSEESTSINSDSEPPKKKKKTVGFTSLTSCSQEPTTNGILDAGQSKKKKAVGFASAASSPDEPIAGSSLDGESPKRKTVGFAAISSSEDAAIENGTGEEPPPKKKKTVGFKSPEP